jgi:hypothetical protein
MHAGNVYKELVTNEKSKVKNQARTRRLFLTPCSPVDFRGPSEYPYAMGHDAESMLLRV